MRRPVTRANLRGWSGSGQPPGNVAPVGHVDQGRRQAPSLPKAVIVTARGLPGAWVAHPGGLAQELGDLLGAGDTPAF